MTATAAPDVGETYAFTARFPLSARAEAFAARITEPGWWATDVVQKGRTVTFSVTVPDDYTVYDTGPATGGAQIESDYRETVGYYGSDQSRKATLSRDEGPARPAPVSY